MKLLVLVHVLEQVVGIPVGVGSAVLKLVMVEDVVEVLELEVEVAVTPLVELVDFEVEKAVDVADAVVEVVDEQNKPNHAQYKLATRSRFSRMSRLAFPV